MSLSARAAAGPGRARAVRQVPHPAGLQAGGERVPDQHSGARLDRRGTATALREAEEARGQGGHSLPLRSGAGRAPLHDQVEDVFEFRGRHEVLDEHGSVIGLLEKAFAKSLLRSHWRVVDATGSALFEARETSLPIALVRRLADVGPDWLTPLRWLPFNFTLLRDGDAVGTYRRVLGRLRDRYVLELGEGLREADRRLVLAFAVALDALQDR